MLLLLGLHAVLGVALLVGADRVGRRGFAIGLAAPLAMLAWTVASADGVLDGSPVHSAVNWVPGLGLAVDARLDAFGVLMIGLVSGIGVLVFWYALAYFGDHATAGRTAGLLTLFAGAMAGLVLADNLLWLFVCWELTSITSYLLIGTDDRDEHARHAALHALLITGVGGLAMLAGFVLLGQAAGTYQLSALVADPPSGTVVGVALVLILAGAFSKSAQYPFHGWLPGAMVAPTPISAYLHSAAMVKAGVYLIARLAPAFAPVGIWRPLVVVVGLTTMLAGGLRALRPFDLKQVLAFGTVSQLGFMVVLVGLGRPEATAAGCALLVAHGLFKAALFMVVGIVDHQGHTRDIRRLSLGPGWGLSKVVAVASAASMAALPPLAGFIAKEAAYDSLLHGSAADRVVLAFIVAGSVLTVAYSARLVAALLRPAAVAPVDASAPPAPAPALGFVAPAVVLALATVAIGVAPVLWDRLVDAASLALDPLSGIHLELWHGFTSALALSALTVAAGAALFAARRPVAALQARWAPPASADGVFDASVRALNRTARTVTGVAQSGSLPVYAAVILVTAAAAPGLALVLGSWWPGVPEVSGAIVHLPVAALLVGGAVAATVAQRRFAAALLLGAVGYGMAVLFVVQGAPDLALTQFAIETLSIVLFLLVMRRLPDRFERRTPPIARAARLTVAGAVGVFVLVMAIAAAGARSARPVSEEMVRRAEPDGGGSNVVNVILVDFRGVDTLGEITVLVVAAIGATALARAGRPAPRSDQPAREQDVGVPS
jgi:multicomponent Na+:H+ antiporter subunit A